MSRTLCEIFAELDAADAELDALADLPLAGDRTELFVAAAKVYDLRKGLQATVDSQNNIDGCGGAVQ